MSNVFKAIGVATLAVGLAAAIILSLAFLIKVVLACLSVLIIVFIFAILFK